MQDDMYETMTQINSAGAPVINRRETLQNDIAGLKKDIKNAQQNVDNSNLKTTLTSSISPERANESKKILVFLKKDLANKQSEYEQLDQ